MPTKEIIRIIIHAVLFVILFFTVFFGTLLAFNAFVSWLKMNNFV